MALTSEVDSNENLKDREEHLNANLQQVLSNNIELYREMRVEKMNRLDVLWNKALERYFLDLESDDEQVKSLTKVPSHITDEIELMDYVPDALK